MVVGNNPLDDVDAFVSRMEEYARLGVELAEVVPTGADPVAFVRELGEQVVPRLADIGAP